MNAVLNLPRRRTTTERLAPLGIAPKLAQRLKIARSLPPERGALSPETARKILAVHIGSATP